MTYQELQQVDYNELSELQMLQKVDAVFNLTHKSFDQKQHREILHKILVANKKLSFQSVIEEVENISKENERIYGRKYINKTS